MENESNTVEELISRTEDYAKTSFELSKLKLMQHASTNIAAVAAIAVSAVLLLLSLLIASIGLSLYLGQLLGKTYYGFFAVSAAYIVIGVFVYFFLQSRIKKSVSQSLQQKLFS